MVDRRGVSLVLGLALVSALFAGCQMMPQGPSAQEQILTLINEFADAGNKGDLETVMSAFADDFMMADGTDKETVRGMLEEGIDMDVEFDASEAEVKVAPDGKSAEVKNVTIDYVPYVTTLKLRGGKWVITGAEELY